jgi:hypothetical protein
LVAFVWSLLLLAAGSLVLVPDNGAGVVITFSTLPVLVALFALTATARRARGHQGGPGPLAWSVVALCGSFALLGILTIGPAVAPVPLLLAVASGRIQEHHPNQPVTLLE